MSFAITYNWRKSNSKSLFWSSIASDISGLRLIATSKYNGVFSSINFGLNWTVVANLSQVLNWTAVSSDSSGKYVVAGASGAGLFTSNNYGSTFKKTYSNFSSSSLINFVCSNDLGNVVIAAISPGGILLSSNYGNNWKYTSASSSIYWYGLAMDSAGVNMYASSNYGIYQSINGGTTWTNSLSIVGNNYFITCDSTGTYIAATSNSLNDIFLSSNAGKSWTTQQFSCVPWQIVCNSNGQTLTVACNPGVIYQSINFGISWYVANSLINNWRILASSNTSGIIIALPYYLPIYSGMSYLPSLPPSRSPTISPAKTPTIIPTAPTKAPSFVPSKKPTSQPSSSPTSHPSKPSSQPSSQPSSPSSQPTKQPTSQPSKQPSSQPSTPSSQPTSSPSLQPTDQPLAKPTSQPSQAPSCPTTYPSRHPSSEPSRQPLFRPSSQPIASPSKQPSHRPSHQPTRSPITHPTSQPFRSPTNQPSNRPSNAPTKVPDCPAGYYYVLEPSGYQCFICPVGYASSAKSSSCTICPAGYFSPAEGSVSCTICPQNQYSSSPGSSSCNSCPSSYVNGAAGSTSSGECVSPVVNFIFGVFALAFCLVATFAYIVYGRLKRVAFNRYFWLIRNNIKMYILATDIMDSVIRICKSISSYRTIIKHDYENKILQSKDWSLEYIYVRMKSTLKPILFIIASLILAFVIIGGYVTYSLMHIIFNALLIWRGYEAFFNSNFTFLERSKLFLNSIDISFNVGFISPLGYPFIYVFNEISSININLAAINISCPGSQAPIYLLFDCIIVGMVIFIIESDAHVFWTTLVKTVSDKFGSLLFNRYYLFRTFFSSLSLYSAFSVFLLFLPTPMKMIQYSLGFVSIGKFFTTQGRSNSNSNCDGATAVRLDTFLAIATTILAIFILTPVIYLFGQVLVPCFSLDENAKDKTERLISDAEDFNDDLLHKVGHKVSYFWRVVFTLSSIDWFYLKAIFAFAESLYVKLIAFGNQFVDEFCRDAEKENNTSDFVKELKTMKGKELQAKEKLPFLPWIYVALSVEETEVEKVKWREKKKDFPSFLVLVRVVRLECLEKLKMALGGEKDTMFYNCCQEPLMVLCVWILSWLIPFQFLYSKVGNSYWKRVAYNYYIYIAVSLGIWKDSIAESFISYVIETFNEDFKKNHLQNYENTDKATQKNDYRNNFISVFSAIVSARSVLLQLIPGMTIVAIFSVDLSVAPLFVSKRLEQHMHPLLLTIADAWQLAEESLSEKFDDKRTSTWKIFLFACRLIVW
jgi:photosystem II stability/assembly factor-like uncharacterized protein